MIRLFCCLVLLAAFVLPAAADIPIDINGQFLPDPGGPFLTEPTNPSISLWNVTGTVDWIGTYWNGPPVGGYSVDLDGNAPGGITSTVPLDAGQQYELTFYLAGNPEEGDTLKGLDVTAGSIHHYDVTAGATPPGTGDNHPWNLNWLPPITFDFTAIAGQHIAFTSTDTSGACGPVVGGVSLTKVPEAGFYSALALNLGGLLFVKRRRKA
jgi:hypothetical protein